MGTPWLSIVIPVYNPPLDLFKKCIESIIGLSMPMEIILVDDGSDQNTQVFCSALTDMRIRYIRQKNQGVSKARMTGIESAKGEYIFFVDADDAVPQDWSVFINLNYTAIHEVWVLFDVIDVFPENRKYCKRNIFSEYREQISRDSALRYMLRNAKLHECWGKLIRRSFVQENNICFPFGIAQGEDVVFNYRVICNAKTIVAYNVPAYIYRYELKNTARLLRNPKKYFDDLFYVYEEGLTIIKICFAGEEQVSERMKLVIGRINGLGSDIVKLMAAKRWSTEEYILVKGWIKETRLLDEVKLSDIRNEKCKAYYLLLKYENWGIFSFLGSLKRLQERARR